MPDIVSVMEEEKIIRVEPRDEIDGDVLEYTLRETLRLHRTRGLNRVLVVAARVQTFPDTLDTFGFASRLVREAARLRFAVVYPPDRYDYLRFLENVARNRGLALQLFESEEAAVRWLGETR